MAFFTASEASRNASVEPLPGFNAPRLAPPSNRPTVPLIPQGSRPATRAAMEDVLIEGAPKHFVPPSTVPRALVGPPIAAADLLAPAQIDPYAPERIPPGYVEPNSPAAEWNLIPLTPASPHDVLPWSEHAALAPRWVGAEVPASGVRTDPAAVASSWASPILANRRWVDNGVPTKPFSPQVLSYDPPWLQRAGAPGASLDTLPIAPGGPESYGGAAMNGVHPLAADGLRGLAAGMRKFAPSLTSPEGGWPASRFAPSPAGATSYPRLAGFAGLGGEADVAVVQATKTTAVILGVGAAAIVAAAVIRGLLS